VQTAEVEIETMTTSEGSDPADALFARLSDASIRRAYGPAGYLLGDAREAEDVTQETMLEPGERGARCATRLHSKSGSTGSSSTRAEIGCDADASSESSTWKQATRWRRWIHSAIPRS
jgi:hypothetical protein